jgi:hypothetical protein
VFGGVAITVVNPNIEEKMAKQRKTMKNFASLTLQTSVFLLRKRFVSISKIWANTIEDAKSIDKFKTQFFRITFIIVFNRSGKPVKPPLLIKSIIFGYISPITGADKMVVVLSSCGKGVEV